jgi:hypothetical protein
MPEEQQRRYGIDTSRVDWAGRRCARSEGGNGFLYVTNRAKMRGPAAGQTVIERPRGDDTGRR